MNIESLLNKIELFEDLVIQSGFQRDVHEYLTSLGQAQNRNIVFMKELSKKIINSFNNFQNNSLDSELKMVLRNDEPFTSLDTISKLRELDADTQINGNQYYSQLNGILAQLKGKIAINKTEIDNLKVIFSKYTFGEEKGTEEGQALLSLIFKDLETTRSLKEFSKVLNRWNRTLIIYHTLLTSESPEEISLVEIQNGSIDVIFNIDLDVAMDLTELIKTGLKVYGGYLLYKSKTAKELISTFMGNERLIEMEEEREGLLLNNIKESVKQKAIEQHKENLKSDKKIETAGVDKKAEEVSEVITDHIIRGNEVKLLAAPDLGEEDEKELSTSLRKETSVVRERYGQLEMVDRKLLLEKYTIKD